MSFLFGKKNKQQQQQQQPTNALPPATREITSSHGPAQQPAALNGAIARDAEKSRGGQQPPVTTPSGSVNNSLSSLQGAASAPAPEQKALRDKTDPNAQVPPAVSPLPCACADCDRMQTPDWPPIPPNLPTLGPPAGLTSPPAIPSLDTALPSIPQPRKMAPSISWEDSLAAPRSKATYG
jgi:hypothetical protein